MRGAMTMTGSALAIGLGLAACSFTPAGNGSGTDGGSSGDDAANGTQVVKLIDNTQQAFDSGTVAGGVIAARGAIEPAAYSTSGLHVVAYPAFTIINTTTFAMIQALTGAYGERYGLSPTINAGYTATNTDARPFGLGLTTAHESSYTLAFNGEIYLDAAATTYFLQADGAGFLEIVDGEASTSMFSSASSVATLTLTPTHGAGWYPIHGAMTHSVAGNAVFMLAMQTTTLPATSVAVPAARFRADVSTVHGLGVVGSLYWDLELPLTSSFDGTAFDHAWGTTGTPYDLALVGATVFSLRYAGQLLIDADGSYQLGVNVGSDVDDGYRIWVDGTLVGISHWNATTDVAAIPSTLTAGWHSIAVDYSQNIGNAQVAVSIASGTGSAAPIAADHLRPADPFGSLAVAYGAGTAIPDPAAATPTTTPIPLGPVLLTGDGASSPVPDGAVIDVLDAYTSLAGSAAVQFTSMPDLSEQLVQPAVTDTLPQLASNVHNYDYWSLRGAFVGKPVNAGSAWTADVIDNVHNGSHGDVAPGAVITWHGGATLQPFTQTVVYTSLARPTPNAIRLDVVHLIADLRGATATLSVRTGTDDASLAAAAYVQVADGAVPAIAAGTLVQYQVEIVGDGWEFPSVASVELDYIAPAGPTGSM